MSSEEYQEKPWRIFLKEKPTKLILVLYERVKPLNLLQLSEKIDTSYSHLLKLVNILALHGLLEVRREGKSKFVFLTDKGIRIAKILRELYDELS